MNEGGISWPKLIISFFFFIIAVNSYLLWLALKTHLPLVETTPYEKGLAFQGTIDEEKRASAAGWSASILSGKDSPKFGVSIHNQADAAISGAVVRVEAMHPSTGNDDWSETLVEDKKSPGLYISDDKESPKSLWLYTVIVTKDSLTYRFNLQSK